MPNKKLTILIVLLLVALATASFVLCRGWKTPQGDSTPVVNNPVTDTVDTSDWKTYRNEEYGFGFEYPNGWSVKEFMTAGIGAPVDCEKSPINDKCKNFSVTVFKATNGINDEQKKITLEIISDDVFQSNEGSSGFDSHIETWRKKVGSKELLKNNAYFPIFGSCYTTSTTPNIQLENKRFHFYTFYEVSGDISIDDAENYCSQEIADEIFDEVSASFFVL